ncbi:helix-turn-helix transcriptional regulator [Pseudoalteromonas piratica]|uniref:helix-turn-helix transcriptional regulator n=1 Tax=Pseudoalteromonas piratica TaxID=1348114 RepID=UPI0006898716|nr:AraC family transcriptional regulator [Pseudoalteromonas piratica]
MQTQLATLENANFSQAFTSHLAFDYGTAFRVTMPAGTRYSVAFTAPLTLVMVVTGTAGVNNLSTYAPSSLLLVKDGFCHFENLDSARDTVILCLSLEQTWLLNFKQRYQALVTGVQVHDQDENSAPLAFCGCDLTRMAMTGLDQLLSDAQVPSLTSLKVEELLLLQINKPQGARLVNLLVESCDPATERFRAFVEKNYLKDWSLEQFAKEIGMSLTAFKSAFNQIYHTSPRAWFNERRLKYAAHLLHTSQMRVIDIAIEAGFSSQSYFTQAYKSRFGTTPKQARK